MDIKFILDALGNRALAQGFLSEINRARAPAPCVMDGPTSISSSADPAHTVSRSRTVIPKS